MTEHVFVEWITFYFSRRWALFKSGQYDELSFISLSRPFFFLRGDIPKEGVLALISVFKCFRPWNALCVYLLTP